MEKQREDKMVDIPYKFLYIYKDHNKTPQKWSENDNVKRIKYSIKIPLYDRSFTIKEFEKYIQEELLKLKIIGNILSFRFTSIHWEDDDCSLYVVVYFTEDETPKQAKIRKQMEKL